MALRSPGGARVAKKCDFRKDGTIRSGQPVPSDGGQGPETCDHRGPPSSARCPGPAAASFTRTAQGQLGVSPLRHRLLRLLRGSQGPGRSHPSTPAPLPDRPPPPPSPVSPLVHEHSRLEPRASAAAGSLLRGLCPNATPSREAALRAFPASRPPVLLFSALSLLRELSPSDSLAVCPFHEHGSSTKAGVAPVMSPDGPQHLAGCTCAGRVPSGHRKTLPRALGRAHLL